MPPPNRRILRDQDVQAARNSVVRVLGTACGLAVQGSGWVAAPEVVVTNAHVVAGEDDTTVKLDGGDELDAQATVVRPSQRRRRPARAGPGRSAARAAHAGHGRRAGCDPRLPEERPVSSRARPRSAIRAPSSARTLTATGRCNAGSRRCAGASVPATPAGRPSRRPEESSRPCSLPPRPARRAASACRPGSCDPPCGRPGGARGHGTVRALAARLAAVPSGVLPMFAPCRFASWSLRRPSG